MSLMVSTTSQQLETTFCIINEIKEPERLRS